MTEPWWWEQIRLWHGSVEVTLNWVEVEHRANMSVSFMSSKKELNLMRCAWGTVITHVGFDRLFLCLIYTISVRPIFIFFKLLCLYTYHVIISSYHFEEPTGCQTPITIGFKFTIRRQKLPRNPQIDCTGISGKTLIRNPLSLGWKRTTEEHKHPGNDHPQCQHRETK